MKKLFLLMMCILSVIGMYAQQVKGYVYDAQTDEALPGVNVSYKYKGELKGVSTDINGFYQIDVPADAISLTFSFIGYETEVCPLVISGKAATVQNINLKPEVELLDEVVVSVGRYEQKLSDITVSMEVVKPIDISRQSPTDLTSVLNTIPGVDVTNKQPSIRGGSGWTYGVGSRSQVLVDGMSVLTPGVGEINWNIIPLENIQQVEVIKGASSVLYGSSALNGLINVRTRRPGLNPETNISAYMGIYGNPAEESYTWWDKSFWKEGKYPVEPMLRKNVLSGVRNPIYNGLDFTHSRRIGNFDVTGSLNIFTDEGYRKGDYNKRVRAGGNLTYHHPTIKTLNYGFNVNAMTNEYGDFFIWHSPKNAYKESPLANMGRQHNMIYVDPFVNYYNDKNKTSHKIRGRFYFKSDNIIRKNNGESLVGILRNMDIDGNAINNVKDVIENPGQLVSELLPPILGGLQGGDLTGAVDAITGVANRLLPGAEREDYIDLISWIVRNPPPSDQNQLIPWALNAIEPAETKTDLDNTYSYFLDYQFSKQFAENSTLTTGATYEHVQTRSGVTGNHASDNIALFAQYDHRFFDKLSLSVGTRLEYYRVDSYKREAETDIFGMKAPFKPVFRGGLNYQLTDFTFLRASFGQGYRYPSLTEKFIVKDIGGVGAYPNFDLKPESGYNAEIGIKQGYKLGPFMGYIDLAGFYSYYKDMIEFDFGLINNNKDLGYPFITNLGEVVDIVMNGGFPAIGVKFSNVSRARIYGLDLSVNGICKISPNLNLTYSLGYMYTQPEDVDAGKRNAEEQANSDLFAMKSKSNTSKYLKYRQKHTLKGTFDLNWNRFSIGTNMLWKSKTLAVDYLMVDEREEKDLMSHVRTFIFGDLNDYWKKNNTGFFTMDFRLGVEVTKQATLQFMIRNLLNTEYSVRPMDVSAPRTFIAKVNLKF